ncbi:hypothetical protein D3C87_2008860 [compost metagenome]
MALTGRCFEMGRGQPGEIAGDIMRHQRLQTLGKAARADIVDTACITLEGNEPLIQPRQQTVV